MSNTVEQTIKELRRPFTPEAVQFKIQSAKGKNALLVCFIDARQTAERLNLVCPGQWSDQYSEVSLPGGGLQGIECAITMRIASSAVLTRTDVGIMEGGVGGLKAVYSDAFKRAGVKWGIGASLYYTPRFFCPKDKLREYNQKFYISDEATNVCRNAYAKWLELSGIERFGQPLDMGDTPEDQGDTEVVPAGNPHAPPTEQERLEELAGGA